MPKTLLLADDSVTIQKVVGISLANEDIQLVTVENGDDAVARARESRPDIVLADIVMPGKNGYEVCEAIKGDPALQGVPVLLLTGTFEAFDAERARDVGADGHITKPFEAQGLVDQVNQLLARSAPLQAGSAPAAPAPPSADEAVRAATDAPRSDDAFDFFDDSAGATGAAEGGWPTSAQQADAGASLDESSPFGGIDLGGESVPSVTPGSADDTVLLDATHAAADPAFDAAVEAAAFDAPGERSDPPFDEADDSGFDLETADLSMASTVPEAPAGGDAPPPPDLTFSEMPPAAETVPSADPLAALPPEPDAEPAVPAAPAWEAEPVVGAIRDLDAEMSHDRTEPLATRTAPPADEETTGVIEDAEPVRVQSTPLAVETAPATGAPEPGGEPASLSPEQWQQVHAALEKVAWEAFGDLSEQVVKQALARVEAIAREVIPQMAEAMIRAALERIRGDDGE